MVERSKKGLVKKKVMVKRGGKTFERYQWVKPGEDEPEEKKPSKKEDFASKLNIGDLVTVGGKILKVKNVSQKSKIVLLEGKLGDESFDFDDLNKRGTLETPEGKFKPGSAIKFMNKNLTIEKVSESEKTVKLSDGKVYTFGAINKGSKIKKVEKKIKRSSIKDLKISTKKILTGSAKDGSLNAKERKLATENMEKFVTELREKEGNIDNNDRVSKAGNYYTKGNCINFNNYLLSDKKKTFDYEIYGLKDISKEDKIEFDKGIKILDKFLDKSPKVKGTSYRAMWWDPNNPEQKEKFDNFIKDLKIGAIVENKPYSSTTASKSMMKKFNKMANAGDIVAEIEYEGTGVYLGDESKEPGQLEVLYKQGIKFEVVSIDFSKNKKKVNIKFREVGYE